MDYNKGLNLLLLVLLFTTTAHADWPTFRGDNRRDGLSTGLSSYSFNELDILWNFTAGGPIYSSPAVSDMNNDGFPEIVFGSSDSNLYALDYKGNLLWKYATGGAVRSSPAIAMLAGNESESCVVFGSDDGNVYALYANGTLFWKYDTGGMVRSSPLIANVDETPDLEIIFGSMNGKIYKLGPDGKEKFSYPTPGPIESSAAAVDFGGDGKTEFVIGSNNAVLYAFKSFPFQVSAMQSDGDFKQTPAVYGSTVYIGSDDSKFYDISYGTVGSSLAGGVSGKVVCTDPDSKYCKIDSMAVMGLVKTYTHNISGEVTSSAAVGYGRKGSFIIAFAAGKSLYVLNSTIIRHFIYTADSKIVSSPALADIDGNGYLEIIVGASSGTLYIINSSKIAVWHRKFDGAIKSSPAVADLTKDRALEIFFGTENGNFYALGSRRKLVIGWGDDLYRMAVISFAKGDYENTTKHLKNASGIYESMNYTEGVRKCTDIENRVVAEKIYISAKSMYNTTRYDVAAGILANLTAFCSSINYTACNIKAARLLKLIDADVYMLESAFYYDLEDFDNATAYANMARRIYTGIGESTGASKASKAINSSVNRKNADILYSQGLTAYNLKNWQKAGELLNSALKVYSRLNASAGITKTQNILNRLEADQVYIEALAYYNSSEYDKAASSADKAFELYNATDMMLEAHMAESLSNKSKTTIQAIDAYNSAIKYFGATDYRSAVENSMKAMTLFNRTENKEGYDNAATLYNKSMDRLTLTSGGAGGGELPTGDEGLFSEENILYGVIALLVLVLGLLLLGKPKEKVIIYGRAHHGVSTREQCRYPDHHEGYSLIPERRVAEKIEHRRVAASKEKSKMPAATNTGSEKTAARQQQDERPKTDADTKDQPKTVL